jgi:hypothetical protein
MDQADAHHTYNDDCVAKGAAAASGWSGAGERRGGRVRGGRGGVELGEDEAAQRVPDRHGLRDLLHIRRVSSRDGTRVYREDG